ncbi:MAG: DNA-3-methyladenine glycosylase I [Phycisphaerae bacterium]|nr:DNA-3-methyladenine glycosylase I [Phycisphaerae bacterium]
MARNRRNVDPNDGKVRCRWAAVDPILAAYHDREWGKRIRTDGGHLQRMAAEIFQCGLSWKIVLVKMPALTAGFHGFELSRVARMTSKDVNRLCNDASIIRNRKKIEATIHNARVMMELKAAHRSYVRWLDRLSTDSSADIAALYQLFRKTFRFMGPETTRCYLMGCGKLPPEHDRECWLAQGNM